MPRLSAGQQARTSGRAPESHSVLARRMLRLRLVVALACATAGALPFHRRDGLQAVVPPDPRAAFPTDARACRGGQDRGMSRALQLGGRAALLNVAYRVALRPRLASWGATDEEARSSLPGDDVLSVGAPTSTMGITIDAPAADVWPWLVQMGCDRAGWYSHDRLDNGGRPSADRIVPDWQRVS